VIVFGTLAVGFLIVSLEAPADRAWSGALFVCALGVRLVAVTLLYYLAARQGGPFLGPDSTRYLRDSADLAARAFHLDDIPQAHFGSYDVAQYYLFAAAIRYVGANLFSLQVLNCSLSALAVPFLFGAARVALPSARLPVAAIAAFGPSLVALCSVDLLKDSSVLCATLGLAWSILGLTGERRLWRMTAYAAVGLTVGLYLRTARFYSFAYLELAFIVALAFVAW